MVRSLVFAIAGSALVLFGAYLHWTDPEIVREHVLAKLREDLPGARIALEAARLRLLGGTRLTDLRIARRDDLDKGDLAYVPEAIVYHDKERLLEGRIAIRKVQVQRPRLRLVRSRDGRWNLSGILARPRPDRVMPTLLVEQGTLLVEDRQAAPGTLPLEVKEIELVLINDPLPIVTFRGSGRSDLLGVLRIAGKYHRDSGRLDLTLDAPTVPVGGPLVQCLASYSPDAAVHLRQLEGTGEVHVAFHHQLGSPEPPSHDIDLTLHQARFAHALLPLALDQIEASACLRDGQVTQAKLAARSGEAKVELAVRDLQPAPGLAFEDLARELDLRVDRLTLDADFFARLPEALAYIKAMQADFRPEGPVNLQLHVRHDDKGAWRRTCVVEPLDVDVQYVKFPYLLQHLTGTIRHECGRDLLDRLTLDFSGRSGEGSVFVRGEILGGKSDGAVTIDVWGENIALDAKVEEALPERLARHLRAFHATGKGNFKADIRRALGTGKFQNHFTIEFENCSLRHDACPLDIKQVSGVLDVRPDGWEFSRFRGFHRSGELHASGNLTHVADDHDRLQIELRGTGLPFDEELRAALLRPELLHAWKTINPSGRFDCAVAATFELKKDAGPAEPVVEATVWPRGCRVQPTFFRYTLDDVHGTVRYARRQVIMEQMLARHGATMLSADRGRVLLKPNGGVWAEVNELRASPVGADPDLLAALPAGLRKKLSALRLEGNHTLTTRLVVDTPPDGVGGPDLYWDGVLELNEANFLAGIPWSGVSGQVACRGRYDGEQLQGLLGNFMLKKATLFGQPLEDAQSRFEVAADHPEVLVMPGFQGKLFGGDVYGPVRVEFGPNLQYELNLTAAQIKLEEFGRHNKLGPNSKLSGLASARLYLSGQGGELSGLTGRGSFEVPEGKMYNLPLLLDLLKVLGLRLPDRTAFEEANASFEVHGPTVKIQKLNLFGNAVSLRGQGSVRLDSNDVNLDFNADWARVSQVLPPGVKKLSSGLSNQLLRIKMRGKLSNPEYSREAIPVLIDPVKKVWNGLREPG